MLCLLFKSDGKKSKQFFYKIILILVKALKKLSIMMMTIGLTNLNN